MKRVNLKAETAIVRVNKSSKGKKKHQAGAKAQIGAEVTHLNKGKMVDVVTSGLKVPFVMDQSARAWLYKYMDPAGSVEKGASGHCTSQIPDGTATHSVGAEIRTVVTLRYPGSPVSDVMTEQLGRVWGLTLWSPPWFRTNWIALSNIENKEPTAAIMAKFCHQMNTLVNYRYWADNEWHALEDEEGWYWMISPLPPTFDLPDPTDGMLRTVQNFRITAKSLTIEHNAPTLLDQGFWAAGQYSVTPRLETGSNTNKENVPLRIYYGNRAPTTSFMSIPKFRRRDATSIAQGLVIENEGNNLNFVWTLALPAPPAPIFSFGLEVGEVIYDGTGIWADSDEVITVEWGFMTNETNVLRLLSSKPGTEVIQLSLPNRDAVQTSVERTADIIHPTGISTNWSYELPPATSSQISTNNPKFEQFLMKESNGVYMVHSKIQRAKFDFTPAGAHGSAVLTSPGYDPVPDYDPDVGIRDTCDVVLSSAVSRISGISISNVLVVKGYFDWEGVAMQNTSMGQFGHAGLPHCGPTLDLAASLTSELTGVYPANDNFLGSLTVLADEATMSYLQQHLARYPQIIPSLSSS